MLYVARVVGAGEEEVELHVNLAELLGFLFKTHGQAFLPAFEELLLPSVLEMATPESLPEDRKVPPMVVSMRWTFQRCAEVCNICWTKIVSQGCVVFSFYVVVCN